MLKMLIQMNHNKITKEKTYNLSSILQTLDNAFSSLGLCKSSDDSDALVYCGTGNTNDYGQFGRIVNALKKQHWFMDNVTTWIMYESDEFNNSKELNEEDLLKHYQQRNLRGMDTWSENTIKQSTLI